MCTVSLRSRRSPIADLTEAMALDPKWARRRFDREPQTRTVGHTPRQEDFLASRTSLQHRRFVAALRIHGRPPLEGGGLPAGLCFR